MKKVVISILALGLMAPLFGCQAVPSAGERGGAAARLGHARLLARLGRRDEAAAAAQAILADDPAVAGARGVLLDLAAAPPPARK